MTDGSMGIGIESRLYRLPLKWTDRKLSKSVKSFSVHVSLVVSLFSFSGKLHVQAYMQGKPPRSISL